MTGTPLTACLFGVPGAQSNLGVGALRAATASGLLSREPGARLTVFDDGWGQRTARVFVTGRPVPIVLAGARNSRRIHRREAYLNMRISAVLGGLGNAGLGKIEGADVVLDVSGGDSFSDIYGEHRFRTVVWPKRLALRCRRPLVLLPQTYGPFRSARARAEATKLLRRSAMAWARDPESFLALTELLGPDLDPGRHREGVDVAFALEPRAPDGPARDELTTWLEAVPGPVVGLNVSGLMTRPEGAGRFGLAGNAATVARRLAQRLLDEPDTRLLIVPHVLNGTGADDDTYVCERLHAELAAQYGDRVALTPPGLDPHQTKWVIARTSWFCGMRMHATIAALSSGVPAAVLAYSLKARGVFASVGQQHHVADARVLDDDDLLGILWRSWTDRARAAAELTERVPAAVARAGGQMDEIVALARVENAARGGTSPPGTRSGR